MDQFEIEEVREELQYHKNVARIGLILIDDFVKFYPCLTDKQIIKLKDLRKILVDATQYNTQVSNENRYI